METREGGLFLHFPWCGDWGRLKEVGLGHPKEGHHQGREGPSGVVEVACDDTTFISIKAVAY